MIAHMFHPTLPVRVLALCALAVPTIAQTTWYVDAAGTAPGDGSLANPYTSINYAVNRPTTLHGDTVLVAPGTYVEHVAIEKGLLIKATAGPLATTIQKAVGSTNVILLDAGSAVLEGFTVTGHASASSPVTAAIFMYDGTVRNCILRNNVRGIWVELEGAIVGSTITANGTGVLTNNFGAYLYVQDSIIADNTSLDFGGNNVGDIVIEYSAGFGTAFYGEKAVLGPGMVFGDPELWDIAAGDLRLAPGSPCIDAGDPTSPLDPDGSRRDIGALPYDASYAPAPTAYCTAKLNSLGCVPSIGATGSASASGSPFTITCSNELSHKVGLLFYGFAPKNAAYQGGYLCVQGPVRRTGLLNAGGTIGVDDCSGVYSYDFDALIQSGGDPLLVAGEIVYAQFWSRDPAASFTSNRSDGLRFGIAP